jgi:hypothetical protein
MKIQINSKKPSFERKKSVEDVVTLGPRPQPTLVCNENGTGPALNLL